MTYSDIVNWVESLNPILVFIIAILTLIGSGYSFYLWITQIVLKPKLNIKIPATYIISRPNTVNRQDFRWGHIEVANKGRVLAKSCQAWISSVRFRPDASAETNKQLFPSRILIPWTGTDTITVNDISAKDSCLLDLFKFTGDAIVFSHDSEGRRKDMVSEKGLYNLEIVCVSDNAKPDKKTILMRFEENHKSPTLELIG